MLANRLPVELIHMIRAQIYPNRNEKLKGKSCLVIYTQTAKFALPFTVEERMNMCHFICSRYQHKRGPGEGCQSSRNAEQVKDS